MRDRLPHICFLAPNAYPLLVNDPDLEIVGGAELQQVTIARGLVQRGYPVSMVCLNFGQADGLEVDGITVHRAFRPTEGVPVLRFLWPRLTSIWQCLSRADADIYYQRAASTFTGVMAAHSRLHGRRSIFAVAGDPMIRFARDKRIYEYGVRNVDCVVVQNEAQKKMVRQRFGRDSTLIPNCYEPPAAGGRGVGPHVLWVSTIRQLKRPEVFLALAKALPDQRFVMVGGPGDGEARLYEEIRARAATLDNLEFVGFVPYARVERYFDDAAVFVNTSDSEGFPNTFLQSWARGIPTVSFVDCGARVNGKAVALTVESFEKLAQTVCQLLENETWRKQIGDASERYVRANHFPERVLDLYEQLFRRIRDERDLTGTPSRP